MPRNDPDFDELEESSTDSEELRKPRRKAGAGRGRGSARGATGSDGDSGPPKQRRTPKRPAGLVNLRSLIEEGVLVPADDVLSVEYKGTLTHASLMPDGRIRWKDLFFESPSAFSIYLKRLVNPSRKADDGWKTVKYAGKFLEQYKLDLLMLRYGGNGHGAGNGVDGTAGVPLPPLPPLKRPRSSGSAAAAPDGGGPSSSGTTTLRQLTPRGRGSGSGPLAPPLPPGSLTAAAAGGGPVPGRQAGALQHTAAHQQQQHHHPHASSAGMVLLQRPAARLDHTPRPPELGSMPPQEHDYAPRLGELAGIGGPGDEPLLPPPGAARHFVTGMELEGPLLLGGGGAGPAAAPACSTSTGPPGCPAPPTTLQPGGGEAAAAAAAAADSLGGAGVGPSTQASGGACSASGSEGGTTGRPRRTSRPPERLIDAALMGGRGALRDHDMLPCTPFTGGHPGSGAPGAQPFRVQVSPLAEVMMDVHAHLDRHEIIGLLAGSWDPAGRLLRVERAFPVREAIGGDAAATDGRNVEMDPEDQFKVTEVILELYGLAIVGWYHSHPSFPPLPSAIDIANQAQMQEQFAPAAALPLTATHATNGAGVPCSAASAAGCAPFVAAIVAPYEQRLPGLQSALTWFTVERRGSGGPSSSTSTSMLGGDGWVPRELSVERLLRRSTPTALSRLLPALGATAARYAAKRSAHALETPWRGSSSSSRLNKLLASVTAWWPALECGTAQSDAFIAELRTMLEQLGLAAVSEQQQQQQQRAGQQQPTQLHENSVGGATRAGLAQVHQQQQQQQQAADVPTVSSMMGRVPSTECALLDQQEPPPPSLSSGAAPDGGGRAEDGETEEEGEGCARGGDQPLTGHPASPAPPGGHADDDVGCSHPLPPYLSDVMHAAHGEEEEEQDGGLRPSVHAGQEDAP